MPKGKPLRRDRACINWATHSRQPSFGVYLRSRLGDRRDNTMSWFVEISIIKVRHSAGDAVKRLINLTKREMNVRD
jgi:hypothetical protein